MSETWIRVCGVEDVPRDGGACVYVAGRQIAVFHFARLGRWYASQNRCPHWKEDALSRGLLGERDGSPYVACPFHKRTFSLETGACSAGDVEAVTLYPVRVKGDGIWIRV